MLFWNHTKIDLQAKRDATSSSGLFAICGAKYMCHNRGELRTEGDEQNSLFALSLAQHTHTFFKFLPQFGIKCVYNAPRTHLFFLFGFIPISGSISIFFPAAFPYLACLSVLSSLAPTNDRRNPQFQLRPNKVVWIETQKRNLILFGKSMDVQ